MLHQEMQIYVALSAKKLIHHTISESASRRENGGVGDVRIIVGLSLTGSYGRFSAALLRKLQR